MIDDFDPFDNPGLRDYLHELTTACGYALEPGEMCWAPVNDPDAWTDWIASASRYSAADMRQRMLDGTLEILRDNIGDCGNSNEDILTDVGQLTTAATALRTAIADRQSAFERHKSACARLARYHALMHADTVWERRPLRLAGVGEPIAVTAPGGGEAQAWAVVRADQSAMTAISNAHKPLQPQPGRPLVRRRGDHYAITSVDTGGINYSRWLIEVVTPQGTFWPLRDLTWIHPEDLAADLPLTVDRGHAPSLLAGTDVSARRPNPSSGA